MIWTHTVTQPDMQAPSEVHGDSEDISVFLMRFFALMMTNSFAAVLAALGRTISSRRTFDSIFHSSFIGGLWKSLLFAFLTLKWFYCVPHFSLSDELRGVICLLRKPTRKTSSPLKIKLKFKKMSTKIYRVAWKQPIPTLKPSVGNALNDSYLNAKSCL